MDRACNKCGLLFAWQFTVTDSTNAVVTYSLCKDLSQLCFINMHTEVDTEVAQCVIVLLFCYSEAALEELNC